MSIALTTRTVTAAALNWVQIIPGCYQASHLGFCLEVNIEFNDSWVIYDANGDEVMSCYCLGLEEGKEHSFNALKAATD